MSHADNVLHQPQHTQQQPGDLLIIEEGGSKTTFKKYIMLSIVTTILIIVSIMYVYANNRIYNILLPGTFLLFIIVDAVMFPTTTKIKVIVDKKHNSLRVFKNNNEQYVSDYPLSKIISIKTLLTNDYYLLTKFNRTALIAVLDNNQKETLIYSGSLGVIATT